MSEYISREAFTAEMKERQTEAGKWLREAKDRETAIRADAVLSFLCEVKLTLDKTPAADVRPVVLCRDCKYWEIDWTPRGVSDGRHYCAPLDLYPSADWYCADGKKREES